MAWFDIGVNLLDSRFDPQSVITNATAHNVTKLCVIATRPSEWDDVIALYRQFPQQLCFTLGVHPHYASEVVPSDWDKLISLAQSPGLVAIGECGLDFNRDFSPRPIQKAVFEKQLELAQRFDLPVYLHERDAFEEQLAVIDRFVDTSGQIRGVSHCFTGTRESVVAYLQRGLYIGVTGWVCDEKRGESLRDALSAIPLERLLLETDAPYLFPKTLRPRKRNNEPAFLPHIGEYVASLLALSPEQVEHATYTNGLTLFGLEHETL